MKDNFRCYINCQQRPKTFLIYFLFTQLDTEEDEHYF